MSVPLLPLSMGELSTKLTGLNEFKKTLETIPPSASSETKDCYENLFRFSSFPEPFSRGSSAFYNRWFSERKTLLLREDIRDATAIREISVLEQLAHLIPERIGSPLSINSLKGDVGVAFETVRDWLLVLEQFFYLFRVTPFTGRLTRTLRKESKVYLYDCAEVEKESFRFENLVAFHLLKATRLWKAMGEPEPGLHYLRDKEKREVDFVLTEKGKPICLIECKAREENLSPHLLYYQMRLAVPFAVQLVHKPGVCKKMREGNLIQWVVSAERWLLSLP